MDIVFPGTFEGFYFRFREVWLDLALRERRLDAAKGEALRAEVFGCGGDVRFGVSLFDPSPPESFAAAADGLVRQRLREDDARRAALFVSPLGCEEEFGTVLPMYLAVRLKDVLEVVRALERFHAAEVLRQDRWRLNKVLNLSGQLRLSGIPEESQEAVCAVLGRRFGVHTHVVAQPVPWETLCGEIGSALDRLWSVAVPAGRSKDAVRVHTDLRALASSAAGPWVRLGFSLMVLDHFVSFFAGHLPEAGGP